MPKLKDLTGMKFGHLIVLHHAGKSKAGRHLWKCRCECGATKIAAGNHLNEGATQSCRCLGDNILRTHGSAYTDAYKSWEAMKQRCNNPNSRNFKNYGARGIAICDRWLNFENFYADMGDRPPDHSLDRIDPNGHYSPENCRWTTPSIQANNKRTNRKLTLNGKTYTLSEWSRKTGIHEETLRCRIFKFHWPLEKALTSSSRP